MSKSLGGTHKTEMSMNQKEEKRPRTKADVLADSEPLEGPWWTEACADGRHLYDRMRRRNVNRRAAGPATGQEIIR